MTKQVAGFITADGRFFEDKERADYEEWLMVISDSFEASLYRAMPTTMLIGFIEENVGIVMSFCEAFEALRETMTEPEISELELSKKGMTYDKDQGSNSIEDEDAAPIDNSGS